MQERLRPGILVWLSIAAGITVPLLLVRNDAGFVFAIILTVLLLAVYCFVLWHLFDDAIRQSKNRKTEKANQEKYHQTQLKVIAEEHRARLKVIAQETSQLERWEETAAGLWSDDFRQLVDTAVATPGDDPDRYAAVGRYLLHIDSAAFVLVLPSERSPMWPIFVVKLERILRLRNPSVEHAQLVRNLAIQCDFIMDFLPYIPHWAESRRECRACATFHTLTQRLPLP